MDSGLVSSIASSSGSSLRALMPSCHDAFVPGCLALGVISQVTLSC